MIWQNLTQNKTRKSKNHVHYSSDVPYLPYMTITCLSMHHTQLGGNEIFITSCSVNIVVYFLISDEQKTSLKMVSEISRPRDGHVNIGRAARFLGLSPTISSGSFGHKKAVGNNDNQITVSYFVISHCLWLGRPGARASGLQYWIIIPDQIYLGTNYHILMHRLLWKVKLLHRPCYRPTHPFLWWHISHHVLHYSTW